MATSSRSPFHLCQEARRQPDHERWLANLRASGARYVVVSGLGDSCVAIPEQAWCGADTARFVPLDAERCAVAYRIRDGADVSGAAAAHEPLSAGGAPRGNHP